MKKPVFKGTPDEWWEEATELTVAETISRELGCWYISRKGNASGNSFHLMTPSMHAVETGKRALKNARLKSQGEGLGPFEDRPVDPDETMSENVRMLIRVELELPEWSKSNLLLADVPGGDGERELWRHVSGGGWTLVMDARVRVTNENMSTLNPKRVEITER